MMAGTLPAATSGAHFGRDPPWDLMYFVETLGKNGAGRMYPDADVETPYVVVPLRR